jgi:hypothetical protein
MGSILAIEIMPYGINQSSKFITLVWGGRLQTLNKNFFFWVPVPTQAEEEAMRPAFRSSG